MGKKIISKHLKAYETAVRCAVRVSDRFTVGVGKLCFLFVRMTGRLTDNVRQEALWSMMFTDDTVVRGES